LGQFWGTLWGKGFDPLKNVRATFLGNVFGQKISAQKLRPKTPPSSGSKSIWGARERGEGEREVKGEGREGKGKRKGKREEEGEEEGDRIGIIC